MTTKAWAKRAPKSVAFITNRTNQVIVTVILIARARVMKARAIANQISAEHNEPAATDTTVGKIEKTVLGRSRTRRKTQGKNVDRVRTHMKGNQNIVARHKDERFGRDRYIAFEVTKWYKTATSPRALATCSPISQSWELLSGRRMISVDKRRQPDSSKMLPLEGA